MLHKVTSPLVCTECQKAELIVIHILHGIARF